MEFLIVGGRVPDSRSSFLKTRFDMLFVVDYCLRNGALKE